MAEMSLEEKIGQLFIIRPDCLDPEYIDDDRNPAYKVFTEMTDGMKETYKEYPAGGFVLFSKNIIDDLPRAMEKYGIKNLTDIIGGAH